MGWTRPRAKKCAHRRFDRGGGEVGVVRRREPVGEGGAVGCLAGGQRLVALEELAPGRADDLARVVRVGDGDDEAGLDGPLVAGGLLAGFAASCSTSTMVAGPICLAPLAGAGPLGAGVAEERGHAPEVVLGPLLVEGVLVALGALDLDAHEQVADGADELRRRHLAVVLVGEDEERLGLALGAGRRHHVADDAVPADVVVEALGEPGGEGAVARPLLLSKSRLTRASAQRRAKCWPNSGRASNSSMSLLRLSRVGVGQEGGCPLARRDLADQVEVDAAKELGVAGQRRGGDVRLREPRLDVAVDGAGDRIRPGVGGQAGRGPAARRRARTAGEAEWIDILSTMDRWASEIRRSASCRQRRKLPRPRRQASARFDGRFRGESRQHERPGGDAGDGEQQARDRRGEERARERGLPGTGGGATRARGGGGGGVLVCMSRTPCGLVVGESKCAASSM